jgi:hypothetical protein
VASINRLATSNGAGGYSLNDTSGIGVELFKAASTAYKNGNANVDGCLGCTYHDGDETAKRLVFDLIFGDTVDCVSGNSRACIMAAIGVIPGGKVVKGLKIAEELATAGKVAAETTGGRVALLGRKADIEEYISWKPEIDFGADFLNIRGTMAGGKKGVGGWNWTRNKRFIDDALSQGEVRLVTSPEEPLYMGGNTYQRELRYLSDKGYGWEPAEDYWRVVRARP